LEVWRLEEFSASSKVCKVFLIGRLLHSSSIVHASLLVVGPVSSEFVKLKGSKFRMIDVDHDTKGILATG